MPRNLGSNFKPPEEVSFSIKFALRAQKINFEKQSLRGQKSYQQPLWGATSSNMD